MLDPKDGFDVCVERINEAIRGLTRYGVRKEEAPPGTLLLTWSNGRKAWYAGRNFAPGEHTVDANQLLVCGEVLDRVMAMLPQLEVLPLYRYSFEASQGETDG